MNITINAVKFKIDEKLQEFINEKVSKLDRQSSSLLGAEVTLRVDKPETDKNKIVDIRLVIKGNDLYASKQADTFEEAVMLTIDALKTQISRNKEKK
ncbi:MAG: HPF/RaiA family ribosome-associated protein [Bacteroidales bacterium]|jgi:ribosomal subunit interface protein|nr:HPF/RaiA family ribosome-associated protein [Bacteroidales bacterium]